MVNCKAVATLPFNPEHWTSALLNRQRRGPSHCSRRRPLMQGKARKLRWTAANFGKFLCRSSCGQAHYWSFGNAVVHNLVLQNHPPFYFVIMFFQLSSVWQDWRNISVNLYKFKGHLQLKHRALCFELWICMRAYAKMHTSCLLSVNVKQRRPKLMKIEQLKSTANHS